MKSNDVHHRGASDQSMDQAKKPWVTPSLQIIALESAEGGNTHHGTDGNGSFTRPHS